MKHAAFISDKEYLYDILKELLNAQYQGKFHWNDEDNILGETVLTLYTKKEKVHIYLHPVERLTEEDFKEDFTENELRMINQTKAYYCYNIVYRAFDSLLVIAKLLEHIESLYLEIDDAEMKPIKEIVDFMQRELSSQATPCLKVQIKNYFTQFFKLEKA